MIHHSALLPVQHLAPKQANQGPDLDELIAVFSCHSLLVRIDPFVEASLVEIWKNQVSVNRLTVLQVAGCDALLPTVVGVCREFRPFCLGAFPLIVSYPGRLGIVIQLSMELSTHHMPIT